MSELFDHAARAYAVDPARNVVLEASAGTGKTRVLVERYVNLLRAGADPEHILAITFTRKAAAEMRDRIIERLREASRLSEFDRARWRELKDRFGDISISTIDAFCLALLREYPLEADVDPGFDLADDSEAPRLIAEALDQALRICRGIAKDSDDVALVFAQLGERRLRTGLSALLDRRLVAPQALRRFLAQGPRDMTAVRACELAVERFRTALGPAAALPAFLNDGPILAPAFSMLAADLRHVTSGAPLALETTEGRAWLRHLIDRAKAYFLTQEGRPRGERFSGTGFSADDCASEASWKRHRASAAAMAPAVAEAVRAFRRDLNVVLSRGVWRIFAVTLDRYQKTLEAHALLDFSGVLERALRLLREMDEFAHSRFKLEARYRHVLVDEFQDTSRAQWDLVAHLIRSWGEGFGAGSDAIAPSIFVVGDRKQSIYGFRDADAAILDEAARFIGGLRGDEDARRAITVSFRAVPAIQAFVNDLFAAIEKAPDRRDAFRYGDDDRFPIDATAQHGGDPELNLIVGDSMTACAERVAEEICRLCGLRLQPELTLIRDRTTGLTRPARPADIAILMRARDAHREFEKALERRGVATYVYKGLGFFDADEVQDAVAVLRYLADPSSNMRAATLLRSRIVRLSDPALALLAPSLGAALLVAEPPDVISQFDADDRAVFDHLRVSLGAWLPLVDRVPPADLLRRVLSDTGYERELSGGRARQAQENLKKLMAMVRRFQNRGYATLARVADHLDELATGDESNAAIDAHEAVSLMTVHAAKGLEFPIVFVVNVNRGTGNTRAPIRVAAQPDGEDSVAIADYQSEADEDAAARDREETKRLLYVALTRARDRLYLGASLANGTFRATRGSLGEVFPPSLKAVLEQAGRDGPEVGWDGADQRRHRFRVAGV